jgi:lipopolysaccharide heptosyltransferase II
LPAHALERAHRNQPIATIVAAINVSSNAVTQGANIDTDARVAVIQVKRGIGDVIWHLPFIQAIAAASPGGHVTFLAPPSSCAEELLAADPSVAETIYFEHGGSELKRAINLFKLAALLRLERFDKVFILDRTLRPALAAKLAGIPERIGLGLGAQRHFITNPGIDQRHFHDQPVDWLVALMAAMNVPFASTEPELRLPASTLTAVGSKFAGAPRPWIALGLGASHPDKDWPDSHWAEFIAGLRRRIQGTVFLVGGSMNSARAANFIAQNSGAPAINACDLRLTESAALLRLADLFVGPSSAPMNLAVAGGTDAFGLFGSTPVLKYSKRIHAIIPPGGASPDGMKRILPEQALEQVAPYLTREKTRA